MVSNSEKPTIAGPGDGLSRRDLIRAVGLSAGGVALGLSTLGGGSTAEAAILSPSGGKLALDLDGTSIPLKAAEGGNAFADIVVEPATGGFQRKRPGIVKFEELVIESSFPPPQPLAGWISNTLEKGPVTKSGALVYFNQSLNEIKRLEFFNAVITEITVPAVDASVSEHLYLTIRLAPESTRLVGPAAKPSSLAGTWPVSALGSNFRLNIQGLEAASASIAKVGALTAKRALIPVEVGMKIQERQFAALDCSVLTVTLAENNAGLFYAWFNDFAVRGAATERPGRIEWLNSAMNVVATADLGNLGIVRYAPLPVSADTGIARVQVEMYCESVSLNFS